MRYAETQARAGSQAFVSEFWRFDAEALPAPVEHIIPPDGLVSIWMLQRARGEGFCGVTGPSVRAMRSTLESGMSLIGARMQPCAQARFFCCGATDLVGKMLPLAAVAPQFVSAFEAAARPAFSGDYAPLERAFEALGQRAGPVDEVARDMASRLIESDGEAEVGGLSVALGLSPQAARRRFRASMGLNPKDFARIRRIRRACVEALSANPNWSSVSLEAGYADQSHFARECRNVFDMPPRELKKTLDRIRHGRILSA
jgi:AraC-like DNA-binding protein